MPRIQVHIFDEGLAEIDGVPLLPEPGQSCHDAVLDQLQQRAQERAATVEATVNDSADSIHFVLEVSPDGSSRLLDLTEQGVPGARTASFDAVPKAVTASDASAVPAPVQPSAGSDVTGPVGVEPAAPTPHAASAIASAVTRARVTAASRSPRPAPVHAADLPRDIAEQLGRIHALEAAGRLDEAFSGASALRVRLSDSAGADHPHALEARAVEAYLAHLRGDQREATVLALGVARMRCSAGHSGAPLDVARATAAWQRLEDERAILTHGSELLHMWNSLHDRGFLTPTYADLADQVREVMGSLAARV